MSNEKEEVCLGIVKENIEHPSYYTTGKIECIDFIFDKELDFALGSAIKYIVRAGKKHSAAMSDKEKAIEDLEKAKVYLGFEIDRLKGNK